MEQKLAEQAAKRKLEDLTVGPVLSWTTEAMLAHIDRLLKIPGNATSQVLPIVG